MATRILTFNPLAEEGMEKIEHELDRLLNRGWKIVSSIGGNRSGRQGGRGPLRTEREVAASAPVSKDYIVLILHRRAEKSPDSKFKENNASQLNGQQSHSQKVDTIQQGDMSAQKLGPSRSEGEAGSEKPSRQLLSRVRGGERYLEWADQVENGLAVDNPSGSNSE